MYHFQKLYNFRPSFQSDLLLRVNRWSPSILKMSRQPSSDLACFQKTLARSKRVVVLTGAGVSAESGVPTFRGAGGLWRTYQAQNLATPGAFRKNPSLVWEFYHYRRELVRTKEPNRAHLAIAKLEEKLGTKDGRLVVITQNIDELHQKAGTKNVIELHGSLFKTRCLKCDAIQMNYDSPIVEALREKGAPDPNAEDARIPEAELPHCKEAGCDGLLRPHVVWFGESLDSDVLIRAESELAGCDLCLVVGTSAVVYPAAMFAPKVAARGVPVAEFNIETTPNTSSFGYYFEGPCGEHLPKALAI